MSAEIVFNGGDEIRQPFLIKVGGQGADLSGCEITGLLYNPFEGETALSISNGGILLNSLKPADGQPHGTFVLDEEATKRLPSGPALAHIRIVVVDADGVTMSTEHFYFRRLI